MSGPWLHQSQQQNGFGHPGHQGHPQQQYGHPTQPYGQPQDPYGQQPPQHFPPNGYQQPGQFLQPYPQQNGQAHKPHIARPSPDTCYNCGAPDHWAQNCPEPRREVPAGDLARQSISRPPFKKARLNYVPPVITKYAVPPNMQNVQSPGTPFGVPYHAQTLPPNYQAPYGPPTPISAQSPGYPQQAQWPGNHQHQGQQSQFQRRNTYPQHPYPAGPSYKGSQYNGPKQFTPGPHVQSPVSAPGPKQFSGPNQPYSGGGQRYGPRRGPYSRPSPGAGASANTTRSQPAFSAGHSRQSSINQSEPVPPQVPPSDDDKEEDELSLLDIPDIPTYRGEDRGAGVRLIKHPLPALSEPLDANPNLLSFPSPSSKGFIKSAYVSEDALKQAENPRSEVNNQGQSHDPIFAFSDRDSVYFPFHVLRECRGRLSIDELDEEVIVIESGSPKRGSARNSVEKYQPVTDEESEVRLAALGVTGQPKSAPEDERTHASNYHSRRSDPNLYPKLQNGHHYNHNGSISDEIIYNNGNRSSKTVVNGSGGRLGEQAHMLNECREPSPTPVPAEEKTSSNGRQHDPFDPEDDGPLELENAKQNYHAAVSHSKGDAPPLPPSGNRATSVSPTLYTPEKKSRKRPLSFPGDSDEEGGNERRRQYDDVTPKLKRRQPKVAEAYSRRW